MPETRTMEADPREADYGFDDWVPPDEAPTANLPAVRQDRGQQQQQRGRDAPMTAEEQRARIAGLLKSAQDRREQIEPFLKTQHVSWDLFLAGFQRAFIRDPKLIKATPASLLQAVMELARVGHVPDGKRAAIVAFYVKEQRAYIATPLVMYQGLLETLYKGGQITKCHAQVIYKGEEAHLEYDLGDEAFVRFQPPLNRDDRAEIVGAYAVATNKEGQNWVEIMGAKELARVKAVSKATSGPGKDWPGEMARKAPLRRLSKFLPQTPELIALLALDDQSYLAEPPPETPERVARAMPDSALLGDEAYTPPPADAGLKPDDGVVDAEVEEVERSAVDTALAMLTAAAGDNELLDARYEAIKTDPEWGFDEMSVEDRARLEMVVKELRDEDADADPGVAPQLQITGPDGKVAPYHNADDWAARMLARVALPRNERIDAWWSRNLDNVEAAILRSPPHAQKVLAAALAKGLPYADELTAKLQAE